MDENAFHPDLGPAGTERSAGAPTPAHQRDQPATGSSTNTGITRSVFSW